MKLFFSSRLPELDRHRYIALIEFSLRNAEFSAEEAREACGLNEREFDLISASIFSLDTNQSQAGFDHKRKTTWLLRPETYFSYLQYLEFRHAIETSKRAYWLSVAAIVLAILTIMPALK